MMMEFYGEHHLSFDEITSSRTSLDEEVASDPYGTDGDQISSPVHTQLSGSVPSPAAEADTVSNSDGSSTLGWPLRRTEALRSSLSAVTPESSTSIKSSYMWEKRSKPKKETDISEVEWMKERFAKLLLGEDMSGGGKGVCTALAISNAITNLSASVFGEFWRLEPLSPERRALWRREMDWLLSVSDYIVEFTASSQNSHGGSMEVMVSRPRSDLYINLPALRKLDAMLLESLDSFKDTEFSYTDQGMVASEREQQASEDRSCNQRQDDKWWLPIPKFPIHGLSEESRKWLQYQRECTGQILKAARSINGQVLSEMEVPDGYWKALPKNAKCCLGEDLYRCLISESFSVDGLLSQLDLSTEHSSMGALNSLESAIYVSRKKKSEAKKMLCSKEKLSKKSSWKKVRDSVGDLEKKALVAERAEILLLCIRQKAPGLPQSILDINKILFNRDVGQSILESYSRVLESLAFNIISRIDDVVQAANLTKQDPRSTTSLAKRREPSIFRKGSLPFSVHLSISSPHASPCFTPARSPQLEPSMAFFPDANFKATARNSVGPSFAKREILRKNAESSRKKSDEEDPGTQNLHPNG